MNIPAIRVPVVCPQCHNESLAELPITVVASALMRDDCIELRSTCHGRAWSASDLEREQIREYLAARFAADTDPAE